MNQAPLIVEPWMIFLFNMIGLTSGEHDAVYEAVINLVEARLKKASSVWGLTLLPKMGKIIPEVGKNDE